MNIIELITKFLPLLDEQYKMEAKSSILDVASEFVQMTSEAKKVKIAKIRVDGLADYSRAGGFVAGSSDLTWEEHEFTIDRGRSIQIDHMDNVETFGLAFGRLAGEFQRVKVVPEIDATRFSKYYAAAGTKVDVVLDRKGILAFIDEADAQMNDDEVPSSNRILFVNPHVYKFMTEDEVIKKNITVTMVPGNISTKVTMYNEHQIITVPSGRFLTAISLLDGTSEGSTGGGYIPAVGATPIGLMMIQKDAVLQLSKRRIARTWAPSKELAAGTDGVNPTHDAWKFDFRIYHDAWVLDEKLKGVYAALVSTLFNLKVSKLYVAPADVNNEDSQENQNAATVLFDSDKNVITVKAPLTTLNSYASTNTAQGSGKWIGLMINTGERSLLGVKYNGAAFAQADITEAASVGGKAGEFVLWIKADVVVSTPKVFTLTKEHMAPAVVTVVVEDTSVAVE